MWSWLRAERVPLTRRQDKLYLKGVKTGTSTEPAALGWRCPPDEWLKTLFASMPWLARNKTLWRDEKHLAERWLRIHLCADCKKAWYVGHHSVKRCAACEGQRQQDRDRTTNSRMIARRVE